jgi:REP element-mobilizing transposase RayT
MEHESLKYGHFYHIYNRGIDSCNLFREPDNYEHFLALYDKYISPVAETFAWVLMRNHFHLLIRVKEEDDVRNLTGFENLSGLKSRNGLKPPHQHFSNLFNAYAKAFNKRFSRHGSLFERPFNRKRIDNERYLKHVILYIHNNPVHHGFCSHPVYPVK